MSLRSFLRDRRDERYLDSLPEDGRFWSAEDLALSQDYHSRARLRQEAKDARARARRPRERKPARVRFVPVERAFKPEVQVRALRGLSGWVQRSRPERGQWSLGAGRTGFVDEDTARLWAAKGHAEIVDVEVAARLLHGRRGEAAA